ncbi:response regulator [Bdellovibrionota bacterium FG-2]
MAVMVGGKKICYAIDDDPIFQVAFEAALPKFGIQCKLFKSPEDLLAATRSQSPDLFLIDLNLGEMGSGLDIISTLRNQMSIAAPILVISGDGLSKTVAEALNLGANDYVVKPLDRRLLGTKLAFFVNAPELNEFATSYTKVPIEKSEVKISVKCEITEIDELGVQLIGRHLLPRGMLFRVSGEILDEIAGPGTVKAVSIISNEVAENGRDYVAYGEFDTEDHEFMRALRQWLMGIPRLKTETPPTT